MHTRHRFARGLLLGLIAAAAACGVQAEDTTLTRTSQLTASDAQVLGFETLSGWSTSVPGAVLSQSTTHSQGSFSLKLKPSSSNGHTPIVSKPLSTLGAVGPVLAWDVMLPSQQPTPSWLGTAQTYINCPSRGIFNAFLAQIELTGKPLNVWNTLSFPVSNTQLSALLTAGYSDLTITVVLTVPIPTTGTYLVDNLRFLPAASTDCAGRPNGTACDDRNACTTGDHCQAGSCQSSPVVCPADQCHAAGTCNPATGVCSNPAKPDGTTCNDGNACTQTDRCVAGACTGSNPVVCVAIDQCHDTGTCATATGACSAPAKPNGTACSDDSPCTQGDVCQDGTCNRGAVFSCPADQPITWGDAPVIVNAHKDYPSGVETPGEVTPPAPVTFTIPDHLTVRSGNAGNGTAELKFRVLPARTIVTCSYHGGARVPHPTSDLELMRGHRYAITSCDNGYQALQKVVADWFSLRVLAGDGDDPTGRTSVSLHAGGGCSDPLPAPMSAEEVVAMRDGFSWTLPPAKLAETDVDGHHALYHGLIYIEHKDQLAALDRLRIYWSAMPLSESYVDGLRGKCGRVEHATDGRGVVVYAVFPAHFYNVMRDFALQAESGNKAPPFKLIIPTPPTDTEWVNADGSLSYEGLGRSGYLAWLQAHPGQQPNWFTDAVETVGKAAGDVWNWIDGHTGGSLSLNEYGFDYLTHEFSASVDFLVNELDDFWEGIQSDLQDFVLVFSEKIALHLNVKVLNLDPQFPIGTGHHLTRAWGLSAGPGPGLTAGAELFPVGAKVRVRQWGWGFLPVMGEAAIDPTGKATVEAVKGASGRGDDLCIELDTPYASITTDLIPNEVCDFDQGRYGDYQQDVPGDIEIGTRDIYTLAQIGDAADYHRWVIGADPHQYTVLTGWLANMLIGTFHPGNHIAMTNCLGFPGTGASIITEVAKAIGVFLSPSFNAIATTLTLVAAAMIEKDLWWPDSDDAGGMRDSRGLITHEYGHFSMCSLLFDVNGPPALTGLIARIFEGQADSKDDTTALMCEAWADTFAMQVVGGANYVSAPGSTGGIMSFCTVSPCMDANYTSLENVRDEFHDHLARYESLFDDAFDVSNGSTRFTIHPGNGDVWRPMAAAPNLLEMSPDPYITNQDERVDLPGPAWSEWAGSWLARGRLANPDHVVGGLVDVMKAHGHNWCDICELLALHDPMTPAGARPFDPTRRFPPQFDERYGRWQGCKLSDDIKSWLGAPPNEFLNMDPSCTPCPLHSRVDSVTGICTACGPTMVAHQGSCDSCAPGVPSTTSEACVIP